MVREGMGCAGVEGVVTDGPEAETDGVDCPAPAPEATAHSRSAHGIARGMNRSIRRNIARSPFIRAKAIQRLCES